LRRSRCSRGPKAHPEGYAIVNEEDFTKSEEELERENRKVLPDALAIKGLGQFERFKAANAFRQLIEHWHVSDFHISAARGRKDASDDSEHLSESGHEIRKLAARCEKIAGSRAIGHHLSLDNERSPTFRHLVSGIRRMAAALDAPIGIGVFNGSALAQGAVAPRWGCFTAGHVPCSH